MVNIALILTHPLIMPLVAWFLFIFSCILLFLIFAHRKVLSPFFKAKFPFGKSGAVLLELMKNGSYRFLAIKRKGNISIDEKGNPFQDYESNTSLNENSIKTGRHNYVTRLQNAGLTNVYLPKLFIKRENELTTIKADTFQPCALNQELIKDFIIKEAEALKKLDTVIKGALDKILNPVVIGAIIGIVFLVIIGAYLLYTLVF